MKPNIRLLIVANNLDWKSWEEKISQLKDWFGVKLNLQCELVHTRYQDIEFSDYRRGDQTMRGVEPVWYDTYISSLVDHHDIVLFVVGLGQWPPYNRARGWRTDKYPSGAVELQIACEEDETLYWNGRDIGTAFFNFSRHEIMHALFMITGQNDTTHYWWDREPDQLIRALEEVDIPILKRAEKITLMNRISDLLKKLIESLLKSFRAETENDRPPIPPPGPTINDLCLAIQEYEDWVEPGGKFRNGQVAPIGSLTWRLKNPGALRFANQIGNIGQKLGFAVFPDYETGFKALRRQIEIARNGKSAVYSPDMNLLAFCMKWAPISDGNNPRLYAEWLARKLKVTIDFKIEDLAV